MVRAMRIRLAVLLLAAAAALAAISPAQALLTARPERHVCALIMVLIPIYSDDQAGTDREADDMIASGFDCAVLSPPIWDDSAVGLATKAIVGRWFVAAATRPLQILLSPDMVAQSDPAAIVSMVAQYAGNAKYMRWQGKPILMTYQGQGFGQAWWQTNVLDPLSGGGNEVAFFPYWATLRPGANPADPADRTYANPSFADLLADSVGWTATQAGHNYFGVGGDLDSLLGSMRAYSAIMRRLGKTMIGNVGGPFWLGRHGSGFPRRSEPRNIWWGIYQQWLVNIQDPSIEIVVVNTWSDTSEDTHFSPALEPEFLDTLWEWAGLPQEHSGLATANRFFAAWFKNGIQPANDDSICIAHRTQSKDLTASGDTEPPVFYDAEDKVYVMVRAIAGSDIVYDPIGGTPSSPVAVGAGLNFVEFPFVPGTTPRVRLDRSAATLATATGEPVVTSAAKWNAFHVARCAAP